MASTILPVGALLGGYRILEVLGRGGMGVVYKARDERTRRLVALKVIGRELVDEAFLVRFQREARAAAAVVHPNVTALYQAGEDQGVPFIAFELVAGGSLRARLKLEGALPWREAVALGEQIARGLGALHAAGFAHRDVKPDNILIDRTGVPKLSDFGLARRTSLGSLSGDLTKTGELVGTLEYMSPEQANGTGQVDGRADLYGLGATLHALLTGRPPFEGTGYSLVKKHLTETPRPPGELVPGIPPALDRLVLRLLAKKPERRGNGADAVADELAAIGRQGAASSRARTAVAIGLGAATLAVAAAFGAVFLLGTDHPEQAAEPAPTPSAAAQRVPARDVSDPCRGFRESRRAKLGSVTGSYAWQSASHIFALAWSPDGKRLYSTGADALITARDAATGEQLSVWGSAVVPNHETGRSRLVLSRDGKRALVNAPGNKVELWDIEAGKVVFATPAQEQIVSAVALAPDGRRAAWATLDGAVHVVDLANGAELAKLPANDDAVLAIAFAGEGSVLLAGRTKGELDVWRFGAGSVAKVPPAPLADVVTSGSPPDVDLSRLLSPSASIMAVAASRDGRKAIVGGTGPLRAIDVETAKVAGMLASSRPQRPSGGSFDDAARNLLGQMVVALALFPDDRRAVVASTSGDIAIWDIERSEPLHHLATAEDASAVAVSPDGRTVAVAVGNGIQLFDAATGHPGNTAGRSVGADLLALSRDGKLLAAATEHGAIVRDAEKGTVMELETHSGRVIALGTSFANQLMTASEDGEIVLSDPATLDIAKRIERPDRRELSGPLHDVALLPSGTQAVALYGDAATLIDLSTGQVVPEAGVTSFPSSVFSLALSPDGRTVLFGAMDRGHMRWVLPPSHDVLPPIGEVRGVAYPVAWSPDGQRAFTCARDEGVVKLWDASTRARVGTFGRGGTRLECMGVSQDGRLLAVGSVDRRVAIYDVATGEELDAIDLSTSFDIPASLLFDRNGRSLYCGTARGVVLRFDLAEGLARPAAR